MKIRIYILLAFIILLAGQHMRGQTVPSGKWSIYPRVQLSNTNDQAGVRGTTDKDDRIRITMGSSVLLNQIMGVGYPLGQKSRDPKYFTPWFTEVPTSFNITDIRGSFDVYSLYRKNNSKTVNIPISIGNVKATRYMYYDYHYRQNVETGIYGNYFRGWEGYIHMFVYPSDIKIAYTSGYNQILPENQKIKIEAPSGYDNSVYHWQYSKDDGNTWSSFNSGFQNSKTLEISAMDIFSSKAQLMDFLGDTNKSGNIQIRLRFNSYKDSYLYTSYDYSSYIVLSVYISAPEITGYEQTPVKCYGGNDGQIKLTLSRALLDTEELEVFVNSISRTKVTSLNPDNTCIIDGLTAKTHNIQVASVLKDNNPTYSDGTNHSKNIIVSGPSTQLAYSVVTQKDISCFGGDDGSIKIQSVGGNGGYKLHWKKKNEPSFVTHNFVLLNEISIDDLVADTYVFYVTDGNDCDLRDINGDVKLIEVSLDQPIKALDFNIKDSPILPSGYGLSNGSITIEGDGGTPDISGNYKVLWKNKETGQIQTNVINNVIVGKFQSTLSNIAKGIYTVEITDDKGCVKVIDCELQEPPLLIAEIENSRQVLCNGEENAELIVHAKGGVLEFDQTYIYQWYVKDGANYRPLLYYTDSIASNLGKGEYRVEVKDHSRVPNVIIKDFTIIEPGKLVTVLTKQDITCFGENNGQINIQVTGGAGGYTLYYKKKEDSNFQSMVVNMSHDTFFLNNLTNNEYQLYIIDANSCIAPISGLDIASVTISQPEKPLDIIIEKIVAVSGFNRSDGSISVKIYGGTPSQIMPYYTVLWKNEHGTSISCISRLDVDGNFISEINGLTEGLYSVEIKDNNYAGVTNSCYTTATFMVNQPEPLTVDIEAVNDVFCNGKSTGILVAHARGGVFQYPPSLPYNYKWYRVKDGNEILITNQTDSIIGGLPAGFYRVKIEDYSNPVNKIESIVFEVAEPPLLVTTLSSRNVSCFSGDDGYIHISVEGGVGGYKLFCKQIGVDKTAAEYPIELDNKTFKLNRLIAGKYEIYIIDGNSCYAQIQGVDIATIEITQPSKALEIVKMTKIAPSGFGRSDGSITLSISGGTPNPDNSYNIIWKNALGQIVLSTTQGNYIGGLFVTSLENQPDGEYTVEIRDGNYAIAYADTDTYCFTTATYILTEPRKLTVEIEETHYISCNGRSDGELVAHVVGGIVNTDVGLPYKYKWYKETNGVSVLLTEETDSILKNRETGNYKVEIEDYSRIVNTTFITYLLPEPAILAATSTQELITCGQTIDVSAFPIGGTSPYRYEWNTGDMTQTLDNRHPGKYFAFIKDTRGCEITTMSRITSPSDLDVSGTYTDPICYGASNGSIILSVTGGTAPYTYQWNNGVTTKDLKGISAGFYTVVVTDRDGCSFSESFILENPKQLTVDIGEDRTLCNGQELTLSPTVEDAKTKFNWTGPNGFTSSKASITIKNAGKYSLTITDSKGCVASDEMTLNVSYMDISSEIVIASQVYVNDTIAIVNISDPEPDRIEWLFNEEDPIKIIQTEQHLARIIFNETGIYSIGIRSHVGDCYQDIIKTITVVEQDEVLNDKFSQSLIERFYIAPNPNDGNFQAVVKLSKESPIRLRIINFYNGTTVSDRSFSGQDEYNIDYSLTLTGGSFYLVLLETAAGQMIFKMLTK